MFHIAKAEARQAVIQELVEERMEIKKQKRATKFRVGQRFHIYTAKNPPPASLFKKLPPLEHAPALKQAVPVTPETSVCGKLPPLNNKGHGGFLRKFFGFFGSSNAAEAAVQPLSKHEGGVVYDVEVTELVKVPGEPGGKPTDEFQLDDAGGEKLSNDDEGGYVATDMLDKEQDSEEFNMDKYEGENDDAFFKLMPLSESTKLLEQEELDKQALEEDSVEDGEELDVVEFSDSVFDKELNFNKNLANYDFAIADLAEEVAPLEDFQVKRSRFLVNPTIYSRGGKQGKAATAGGGQKATETDTPLEDMDFLLKESELTLPQVLSRASRIFMVTVVKSKLPSDATVSSPSRTSSASTRPPSSSFDHSSRMRAVTLQSEEEAEVDAEISESLTVVDGFRTDFEEDHRQPEAAPTRSRVRAMTAGSVMSTAETAVAVTNSLENTRKYELCNVLNTEIVSMGNMDFSSSGNGTARERTVSRERTSSMTRLGGGSMNGSMKHVLTVTTNNTPATSAAGSAPLGTATPADPLGTSGSRMFWVEFETSRSEALPTTLLELNNVRHSILREQSRQFVYQKRTRSHEDFAK